MAWTSPVDYSTGQIITASIWNGMLGVSGNMEETAPAKVTTAGDIVYGTGANAIARLAVGTANQVLKVNSGATAPEWSAVAATELTAGNDKVFYSNSSGVVTELALGDANTVLTSSGPTSAPTFEVAATGGMTLTSGEAITAGMGVYVTSSGTAKKALNNSVTGSIGSTPFTDTAYDLTQYPNQNGSGAQYYDTAAGCFVKWAQRSSSSYSPTYQGIRGMAIVPNSSDNTYTVGTALDVAIWQQTDAPASNPLVAWYDENSEVGLVYQCDLYATNYLGVFPATVSGTTISNGSLSALTDGAKYGPFGLYINDLNYSLMFYGSSSGMCVRTITPSGTSAPTWGSEVVLDSTSTTSTSMMTTASYDPVNKVICVVWLASPSGPDLKYIMGTISGSTITWGTLQTISTLSYPSSTSAMTLCYRSFDEKWCLIYSMPSSLWRTHTGTWSSGTTMSWVEANAVASSGGYLEKIYASNIDDGAQAFPIQAQDSWSGTRNWIWFFTLQSGSYEYDNGYSRLGEIISSTAYTGHFGITHDPVHGRALATAWNGTDNAVAYGVFTPPSGADRLNSVIGVAQSTVGTGVSVEIKSLGAQDDNQAGLTAGTSVYLQNDATIGHGATSVRIGRAIDADSILITNVGSA